MRKKTTSHPTRNTLRLLIVFCCLVALAIIASLTYRLVQLIRDSNVDNVSFVLLAISTPSDLTLIGLNTDQKTLAQVTIKGSASSQEKRRQLAVIPDGTVTLEQLYGGADKTAGLLLRAFLHKDQVRSNLSSYDLLRLALMFQTVAPNSIETEVIALPQDGATSDDVLAELFSDTTLTQENKSIAVVNATGVAGLGKEVERVITIRGGNVISVTNDEQMREHSVIRNSIGKNYTVSRLKSFLDLPVEENTRKDLSDIMVIIGKDFIDNL